MLFQFACFFLAGSKKECFFFVESKQNGKETVNTLYSPQPQSVPLVLSAWTLLLPLNHCMMHASQSRNAHNNIPFWPSGYYFINIKGKLTSGHKKARLTMGPVVE